MSKTEASKLLNQARARRVPRLSYSCDGPSRAKQSFKNECDINTIMKKFEKTGVIEHVKQHGAKYGDFLDAPADYHEAANIVVRSNEMFLSLPAKVRKAFDNDPGTFLAAIDAAQNGDADVRDELIKLGLLKTPPKATPSGVPQGAAGEPETTPEGSGAPAAKKAPAAS